MNAMSIFLNNHLSQLQKQYAVARFSSVAEQISTEIEDFQSGIPERLGERNPFKKYQIALDVARENFRDGQGVYDIHSIKADFDWYKKLCAHGQTGVGKSDTYFCSEKIQKLASRQKSLNQRHKIADKLQTSTEFNPAMKDVKEKLRVDQETCRRDLQKHWQEMLDKKYAQWKLNAIAKWRRELLQKLRNWLDWMQQLADALSQLPIEPGVLFDLSKDNLSLADVDTIKRWATYLAQNEGVRRLCEMLGRLGIAPHAKRKERVKTTVTKTTVVRDTRRQEKIIGVTFGKDIEHTLPQELALLAGKDTSLLFDIKFAESRLMHFDMEGQESVNSESRRDALEEVDAMGPMIICVDTSASMDGPPETIAKAVALYMATKAISQKRNCYLITFSTGIDVLDLSERYNIKDLIDFLQQSFHGRTDVWSAVEQGLSMMEKGNYEKSDLLIISDFVAPGLHDKQRAKINEFKQKENKFYALSTDIRPFEGIFDGAWIYDPYSSAIRQWLEFEVADR